MNNKGVLIVLSILTVFTLYPASTVKEVHNTMKEIDSCMGKVQLTLVRTWGGDDEEDENKFFKYPMDMVVDKKGMVFICDEGNHRIQVFDEAGNYHRTIGRRGNGPADFLNPNAVALNIQGNLVVADVMNIRIQVLTPEGKYISGFKYEWKSSITAIETAHKKDEILIYNQLRTFYSRKLLFVYDKNGRRVREIGKYVDDKKDPGEAEGVIFELDDNDNIYTAYSYTPYFLKFSYTGDISMLTTYETPYELPSIKLDIFNNSVVIKKRIKSSGTSSLYIDSQGLIYIVGLNRQLTENDKESGSAFVFTKNGSGMVRYMPPLKYGKTDIYRLLVFNTYGKIIAATQLDVYLNKVYIHDDRLFLIDTYRAMNIYEYKINFR